MTDPDPIRGGSRKFSFADSSSVFNAKSNQIGGWGSDYDTLGVLAEF